VSLTLLFGLMTLAPAVIAIIFGILSRVSVVRVPPLVAIGVALLTAAVPVIGLILLASDLAFPTPLRFAFAGTSDAPFAPLFRADGLAAIGGWGIAALIMPLLLWIVWMDAGGSVDSAGRLLPELGLALGLEAVALQLVFSDNLLWLGLVWVLMVALAWLLGEQGAESGDLDYLGLATALIGPVLTMLLLVLIAIPTKDHTFFGLTGHPAVQSWQIFALAVTFSAAGGGYPFAAWVRRRAAFATPSGFASLVLLVLPVVAFVGARAWGALRSPHGLWPEIGQVTPPITGGIALAVLGTLTIAISGLLALGRRDGRTLVALLATAQVGWAMLALGASQTVSVVGMVVLLATGVVGGGAMTAALISGGILTADDEPEGAGPVPFGVVSRPLNLFAWCVGAATALGVPLFGGFVARHLITAGTLSGTKLGIPLLGLAWLGDLLFAVALIRATVLAFKANPDEATDDAPTTSKRLSSPSELLELPGTVLALAGMALGIFPQVFLNFGVVFAVDQLDFVGGTSGVLRDVPFGYATSKGEWQPGIFWLAALVLGIVIAVLRWGVRRTPVTLETTSDTLLTGMENDALDEPAAVWFDFSPAFTSQWTQVAGKQLIGGIDEDDDFGETSVDDEDEGEDDSGPDDTIPPDDADDAWDSSQDEGPANGVIEKPKAATPKGSGAAGKATKQGTRNAEKRGQVQ
jgi:formate hydrogenlyase subunit 3/multisubunit Na+/H+ antiporter MnhD subunit